MQRLNFDELTKALATSPSRRHALKTIVTASLGSLLGLTSIRSVFGGTGNSNCAKFCAAVFGQNSSAAGQCTSDAAHGKGLCKQCGNVNPSSICCVRNSSGFCKGTAPATCCASGQHCENAACVPNCSANRAACSLNSDCCSGICCFGVCCDSGQICVNGDTCAIPCASDGSCPCGTCATHTPPFCRTEQVGPTCFGDDECVLGTFCDLALNACVTPC